MFYRDILNIVCSFLTISEIINYTCVSKYIFSEREKLHWKLYYWINIDWYKNYLINYYKYAVKTIIPLKYKKFCYNRKITIEGGKNIIFGNRFYYILNDNNIIIKSLDGLTEYYTLLDNNINDNNPVCSNNVILYKSILKKKEINCLILKKFLNSDIQSKYIYNCKYITLYIKKSIKKYTRTELYKIGGDILFNNDNIVIKVF